MKIIDPHIHLFDLANGDYHWLKPHNPPFWPDKKKIAKTVLESALDLPSPMQQAGFVHIEAGFDNKEPWLELKHLEKHCSRPFKSIAMLDITLPHNTFEQHFSHLKRCKSFVGVRFILEDVNDSFFEQPNVVENLTKIAKQHYIYELQCPFTNTKLVNAVVEFCKQYPLFKLAICHIGFPPNEKSKHKVWEQNLRRVAQFKNVIIKCSGMEMISVTKRGIDFELFNQHVATCIELFSDDRVLLASNFPVVTLAMPYQAYWQALASLYKDSPELWEKISFKNAAKFYQITR